MLKKKDRGPAPISSSWSRGVTVSTLDSESSDRGSNPRGTYESPQDICLSRCHETQSVTWHAPPCLRRLPQPFLLPWLLRPSRLHQGDGAEMACWVCSGDAQPLHHSTSPQHSPQHVSTTLLDDTSPQRFFHHIHFPTAVLHSTPAQHFTTTLLHNTTKYYSSTTLYYKVLLQYHSVLQSTCMKKHRLAWPTLSRRSLPG